jgi:hypothetical protein
MPFGHDKHDDSEAEEQVRHEAWHFVHEWKYGK